KSLTTSFGITFLMIYLLIVFESLFKPTSISNFLHAWLCLPISLFFCGLSAFINWLKFLCATLTELLLVFLLVFPLYYAIMDPPESEVGGLYGFAAVIWFVTFIVVFASAPAYCFFTGIISTALQLW